MQDLGDNAQLARVKQAVLTRELTSEKHCWQRLHYSQYNKNKLRKSDMIYSKDIVFTAKCESKCQTAAYTYSLKYYKYTTWSGSNTTR